MSEWIRRNLPFVFGVNSGLAFCFIMDAIREGRHFAALCHGVVYLASTYAAAIWARSQRSDAEKDTTRLDTAQRLYHAIDFDYDAGENGRRSVALIDIPRGVRIGVDLRQFLDAAAEKEVR